MLNNSIHCKLSLKKTFSTTHKINKQNIDFVELRSDVKTLPTQKMRESVLFKEFGDNNKFEDEVVEKLERKVAKLLGKERGLYVPSGLMGNYVCILLNISRGDYLIQGEISHIHKIEIGTQNLLGIEQIVIKTNEDATLDINEEILLRIIENNKKDDIVRRIKVLTLENTNNFLGGAILPLNYIDVIKKICVKVQNKYSGFAPKFHLDGSRVLNAAAALNCDPAELVKGFDTVNMCLSKGVGAPVGSVVCLDNKHYLAAAEIRRLLGGAMRQAGFIAAPALIALEDWRERFNIDHKNAKLLYNGIRDIKGIKVRESDTNIINVVIDNPFKNKIDQFIHLLDTKYKVKVSNMFDGEYIRLVTHHQVSELQIQQAIDAFNKVGKEIFG